MMNLRLIAALWIALMPVAGFSQQTAFGSATVDPDTPVEVESDELRVNQDDGTAEFIGNVVIVQGPMRLAAPRVLVIYDEEGEEVREMEATGGVTMVSGEDAAEAQSAFYNIENGKVRLTGDVLLVQGESTLASQDMTIDLTTGSAQASGRVKTLLNAKD
ncbi:LptA/OstA family protein [Pseudooceanicola sp. MF1-13]|uniref:LptA/OstA family protein n=1 Tax=Pseudooceanicola sp. MF1-13 TaxID=3379095 RepID=UPI0038914C52